MPYAKFVLRGGRDVFSWSRNVSVSYDCVCVAQLEFALMLLNVRSSSEEDRQRKRSKRIRLLAERGGMFRLSNAMRSARLGD